MNHDYRKTLRCFDAELENLIQLGPANSRGDRKVCITEHYVSTLLVTCAIRNREIAY